MIKSLTVVNISPRVVHLDDQIFVVQNSKSINDMSTERGINVLGQIFSIALAIPSPICKVAHHQTFSYKTMNCLCSIFVCIRLYFKPVHGAGAGSAVITLSVVVVTFGGLVCQEATVVGLVTGATDEGTCHSTPPDASPDDLHPTLDGQSQFLVS